MDKQLDIDDCLIENARKTATEAKGKPYLGDVDWPAMVLDLVRINDQLKQKNTELLQAVQRNAQNT